MHVRLVHDAWLITAFGGLSDELAGPKRNRLRARQSWVASAIASVVPTVPLVNVRECRKPPVDPLA